MQTTPTIKIKNYINFLQKCIFESRSSIPTFYFRTKKSYQGYGTARHTTCYIWRKQAEYGNAIEDNEKPTRNPKYYSAELSLKDLVLGGVPAEELVINMDLNYQI